MRSSQLRHLLLVLPVSLTACELKVDPNLVRDNDASASDSDVDAASDDGGDPPQQPDGGDAVDADAQQPDGGDAAVHPLPPGPEDDGGAACGSDADCERDSYCEPAGGQCLPRCSDEAGCYVWRAPSNIGELASDGARVYFSTLTVRDDLGNITEPGRLYGWDGEDTPVALLQTEVTSLSVVDGSLYVFRLGTFVGEHYTGELVRVAEGAVNQTERIASKVTWVWASGSSLYWSELLADRIALQRLSNGSSTPELLLERPLDAFLVYPLRAGWFNGDDGHALRYLPHGDLGSTLTADDLSDATKWVELTGPFGGFGWSPTLVDGTKVYAWTESSGAPLRVFDIADAARGYLLGGSDRARLYNHGSLAIRDGYVLWSASAWDGGSSCLYGRSEDRADGLRELLPTAPAAGDLTCRFTLHEGRLVYASGEVLYERALDP